MAFVLLGLVTLLLAACGGGSDSSGPSSAPELTNLRAQQGRSGSGGTFILTVDVLDRDGDVFGGQCAIVTNIGTVTNTISSLGPGVAPNAKVASVSCGATYTGTGGQIAGQIYVIDRAGHQSNGLDFRLNAEGVAGSRTPPVLGEAL